MNELNESIALRKMLYDSLGDRKLLKYKTFMKLWFNMKGSKDELQRVMAKFLSPVQFSFHNQYFGRLIRTGYNPSVSRTWKKTSANRSPSTPTMDLTSEELEKQSALDKQPVFMVHEGTLLTSKMMLDRLQYGAWELELEGASPMAAEYLCAATKHFLKDILTAIVCRRKGFKTKHNKFVYDVGSPQLNPWLRNVPRAKLEPCHPIVVDKGTNGFLAPSRRPAKEILEQSAAFDLAASDSSTEALAPITLIDLAVTMKVHPSLVASNFVSTVTWERLYAKIDHPTWDS